jgi:Right handed beta helix region
VQHPIATGRVRPGKRSVAARRAVIGVMGLALATLMFLATSCADQSSRGDERPAEEASSGVGYYVSADGSDDASGTTPGQAWRTVERVNQADLQPGETVHFQAGDEFADTALSPTASGRSGTPIRFTSYGTGRALLPEGVYLESVSSIELDRLSITGPTQGIASSSTGDGAQDITISDSTISDVAIGINAANPDDRSWRIIGNAIARTGDSGIIIEGSGFEISGNTIANTGRDDSISYAKHGLYAKGPDTLVLENRFVNFETEGVSTRYRNASIVRNTIEGGETGVGFYREDSRVGTTLICGNRIDMVEVGVYLDPRNLEDDDSEHFHIFENRIRATTGTAIDAGGLSSVEQQGNTDESGPAIDPETCS